MNHLINAIAVTGLLLAPMCSGQVTNVIDFEHTPSGAIPTDDDPLDHTEPYVIGGISVTIGFDTNNDLVADVDAKFEQRGEDGTDGFGAGTSGTGLHDYERTNSIASLGDFFLRQPAPIGSLPGPLIITYSEDIQALAGEIWDIEEWTDGTKERWRVISYDAGSNILESIDSPEGLPIGDPDCLDSLPWTFVLRTNGIRKVEIRFIGNSPGAGLAFNNFRPTTPDDPRLFIETAILLRFQSAMGRTYTIQSSLDMTNWVDAVTNIVGDGAEWRRFFEITTPKRFYRLEPPNE